MNFIPYGRQSIDDADVEAVSKVLRSDFLTTGPAVEAFERALAEYCGAAYCIALANGTAALHLASLALLQPGDRVLTTPNSFLATSNGILYAGGVPVFVDVGEDGNLDLDACEAALEADPSIKAIYAVHFSGNPVDQRKLADLRARYGVTVLEDCAHAIGASFGDVKAGSCTHSECSILSFHPVKHLTTAEGGAVTTNDEGLYRTLLQLRNHGIARDGFLNADMAVDEKGNPNPWYHEMHALGFNYRITDMQCALGSSQLAKLDGFIERRRELARRYDAAFADEALIRPLYAYDGNSSYHLYVVRVDFDALDVTKAELFMHMREHSIGLQLHYIPINRQPYYRRLGYGGEATPRMDAYYAQAFSLPLYPALTDEEQRHVFSTLCGYVNAHVR